MKYQAQAWDKNGESLKNSNIRLKASFYSGEKGELLIYTEYHQTVTNELGLFSLVIGEGSPEFGVFSMIPWDTDKMWIDIAISHGRDDVFSSISKTRLYSVPYAMHAGTASRLSGSGTETFNGTQFYWSLNGNTGSFPPQHFIGTRDQKDLVFKTDNTERLVITKEGEINMGGSLEVGVDLLVGNDAIINNDLRVENNLSVGNDVDVENDLNVDIDITVGNNASVGNNLDVDNNVSIGNDAKIENDLIVTNNITGGGLIHFTNATESTTKDNGAVLIEGGVGIEKNVNIGGTLGVEGTSAGFMAHIYNADGSNGDGLEIRLGKTHPAWNNGSYLVATNPAAEYIDGSIQTIRGWVEGQPFVVTDVLNFIPNALLAGTACRIVESLSGQLNDALGLPVSLGGLTDIDIFDAANSFADDLIADAWRPDNPTTIIPAFNLGFPTDLGCDFLPSFSIPNISFVNVSNSLTNANQFVSFKDKDNRELGSIKAVGVTEWGNDFFDGRYLIHFVSNVASLDPLDAILSAFKEFSDIVDSYNSIGVEYASGHGDYAEWLERADHNEIISRGDIVAVKGGKITKNLENAEQVMAVSEYPIVLGNMPEADKVYQGNNVAFMGQIPVKIFGPVKTGDYIIADSKVPGYGIAKSQNELTIEDMHLVVGRSWENMPAQGPKMVNTVVGVHNGDYSKILKRYEDRLRSTEARLNEMSVDSASRIENLESKVDLLLERMNQSENQN